MYLFFSSRRRHTRYWRDWSSDVCSSDLQDVGMALGVTLAERARVVDQSPENRRPHAIHAFPSTRGDSLRRTLMTFDHERAAASWPHAASMSRPRVSRTVAGIPCSSSTARNVAMASRPLPSYADPVGLNGIRLTL